MTSFPVLCFVAMTEETEEVEREMDDVLVSGDDIVANIQKL